MYSLPKSVKINGKEFHITNNGDFRMVLDCFSALRNEELGENYRVLATLLIFYNEFNKLSDIPSDDETVIELVTFMFKFFSAGAYTEGVKPVKSYQLLDWERDEPLICSAINKVANAEIRELPYMHWYTFMGYYGAVGESTLSSVVRIRGKIMEHKKLEKNEKEFKRDNPQFFIWDSGQANESAKLIEELWDKG